MARYEDVIKSLNKHIDAIEYYLNTNTESGVTHIPEGILESVVEDYKSLKECNKNTESVKYGQWIDLGDHAQCSCCKATRLLEFQSYYGKSKRLLTDYCPDCGARMSTIVIKKKTR